MRQRQPRIKDETHLANIRTLQCLLCGFPGTDAAHIRFGDISYGKRPSGMAERPCDWAAVPMCRSCHASQHSRNEKAFWAEHGIDPLKVAAALYLAPDQETREAIIEANRHD